MSSINDFVSSLRVGKNYQWAFSNCKFVIEKAISEFNCVGVLEIGGGRRPLFTPQEIALRSLSYTVNDVDQSELDRLQGVYDDVLCADLTMFRADRRYDIMFSRFVYEHVSDNRRSLENQLAMLNDGGLVIHFHPVLYSLPFVANYVLDERLSQSVLKWVFRGEEKVKFPAHYDWCVVSEVQRRRLLDVGFSEAVLVPFYGHHYYARFPLVRDVHRLLSGVIGSLDLHLMASYCFTIARK